VDALHACLVFGAMNMAMMEMAGAVERECGVISVVESGTSAVAVLSHLEPS
jgi:hypothetical protein